MLNAVPNLPLKDRIAEVLRQEIAAGRLSDGQELTQESLSEALSVSRIPLREAFLQLEAEGLLQRLPNRHVRVVGVTSQRLCQNFRVLASMEGELARLALEAGEARRTMEALAALEAADSWERAVRCDEDLHRSFAAALDNPGLQHLHKAQRQGLFLGLFQLLPPDQPRLLRLDQRICQALADRDSQALQCAIAGYYEAFRCAVEELSSADT